jgi:hypothetical protein
LRRDHVEPLGAVFTNAMEFTTATGAFGGVGHDLHFHAGKMCRQ